MIKGAVHQHEVSMVKKDKMDRGCQQHHEQAGAGAGAGAGYQPVGVQHGGSRVDLDCLAVAMHRCNEVPLKEGMVTLVLQHLCLLCC